MEKDGWQKSCMPSLDMKCLLLRVHLKIQVSTPHCYVKGYFTTISPLPLPKFLLVFFCSFNPSSPHQLSLDPKRSFVCAETCRSLRDFSKPSASFTHFSHSFILVSQVTITVHHIHSRLELLTDCVRTSIVHPLTGLGWLTGKR